MLWLLFTILDYLIFALCTITVLYMIFFALASLGENRPWTSKRNRKQGRFLFITTASRKDTEVEATVKSILAQDYEEKNFDLIVVGDNLTPLLNIKLAQYPITFVGAPTPLGSKAQALQLACDNMPPLKIYDMVILIDPDETVGPSFLTKVNQAFQSGYTTLQAHRTEVARSTSSRMMAATFEEINNAIFRTGHNNLGLSSALVGSGICLEYEWFKENIHRITTQNDEKDMEILLLKDKKYIDYMADIHVYVSLSKHTREMGEQRRRWAHAQFSSLRRHIHLLPAAVLRGNLDLADKLLQWMLIPRITLLSIIVVMSAILPFIYWSMALKWWILAFLFPLSLAVATPDYIVNEEWVKSFRRLPLLIFYCLPIPSFLTRKKGKK